MALARLMVTLVVRERLQARLTRTASISDVATLSHKAVEYLGSGADELAEAFRVFSARMLALASL